MKYEILNTLTKYLDLISEEADRSEEIHSLMQQIGFMRDEIRNEYTDQLTAFRKHMNDSYDALMDSDEASDKTRGDFYNSDFVVTWRGESVTIYNGADVFTAIEDIIDFELSERGEA